MTHEGSLRTGRAGRGLRLLLWSLLLVLGLGLAFAPRPAAAPVAPAVAERSGEAVVIHLDGVIGPASAGYLSRALAEAAENGAGLVVVRMDTPGGLDTSMREMIREIIASPTPVAVWVAPGGARAASAGTYLLYAAHIAAMAPGTNVGAATPVQLGGSPAAPGAEPEPDADEGASAPDASEAKAVNDAVAYIRSLADLRGRNADWAERAVRQSESLSARDALAQGVIDFIAEDIDDLLARSDGRTVMVAGAEQTISSAGLTVREVRPALRDQVLSVLTNPNIALLLMMIGVYGLIFEFMNPGAIYPGAIGAVCLVAGLYALAVLPLNYAGLILIGLGLALMLAEGFAPSFGALGIVGGAAFIFGAMILFDTAAPGFGVSLPLIAGMAVAGLAFSLVAVRFALASRRRPVTTGREEMIGARGVVQNWTDRSGHVFVHSERWRAVADRPLTPGDAVIVTAIDSLTLTVTPAADPAAPD